MIILAGVSAVIANRKKAIPFLSGVDLTLPSDRRIALLGTEVQQTRALMFLLAGLAEPRAGRVVRHAKISFPVGNLGGFAPNLPVRENVAHLARLYDVDVKATVRFVQRNAKLGEDFDKPCGLLAADARQSLAIILGYALPFDTYLLLRQPKAPTNKKKDIAHALFEARRHIAGMVIPTANKKFAVDHCEMGLVFARGSLRLYDNVEDAFNTLQAAGSRESGTQLADVSDTD